MRGSELLELLIGTLDRIQRRTPSVFAFREMFYDLRPILSRPWRGPQSDTWSSWQNKRTLPFPCGGIWRFWVI